MLTSNSWVHIWRQLFWPDSHHPCLHHGWDRFIKQQPLRRKCQLFQEHPCQQHTQWGHIWSLFLTNILKSDYRQGWEIASTITSISYFWVRCGNTDLRSPFHDSFLIHIWWHLFWADYRQRCWIRRWQGVGLAGYACVFVQPSINHGRRPCRTLHTRQSMLVSSFHPSSTMVEDHAILYILPRTMWWIRRWHRHAWQGMLLSLCNPSPTMVGDHVIP